MAPSNHPDTRTSLLAFWKHYLVAATLLLVARPLLPGPLAVTLIGLAGLILLHAAAVVCFGTRWWITSGEVVQSRGVVSRHTEDLWLADLSRGEVKQDFVERLLGVGSISVATLPEPSAWLLVLGACLLGLRGRR